MNNIILRLKELAKQERQIEAEMIRLLHEVERTRLYAERGYSSLFVFCVQELGLSEGAAFRRTQAAKLYKVAPQVAAQIESGELSITNASKINQVLKEASQAKVELPKEELIQAALNTGTREAEKKIDAIAADHGLARPKEDEAFRKKVEQLRAWLSHQHPGLTDEGLFKLLVEQAHEKLDPEKKPANFGAEVRKPEKRHIPQQLKRAIYLRDEGRCTYVDKHSGRRCEATHFLEYDHIVPYAKGGLTKATNLRLCCRTHNQLHAKRAGLRTSAPK